MKILFLVIALFLISSCGGKAFTEEELKICDAIVSTHTKNNRNGYDKKCNLYNDKKPDVTMVDKSRTTRILLTPILLPFGIFFFSATSLNSKMKGTCIAKGFNNLYSKQIGNTYYGWCLE